MREYAIGEVYKGDDSQWHMVAEATDDGKGPLILSYDSLPEPPDLIPMQVDLSAIKPEKREKKVRKMLEAAECAGVKWVDTGLSATAEAPSAKFLNYWSAANGIGQSDTLYTNTNRLVRPREWIARMEAYAERKEMGL